MTNRYSTYSTPSTTDTLEGTTLTTVTAEIDEGLRRLDNARLSSQRYAPSDEKTELLAKLALSAKLERALRWRMSSQDAEFRGSSSTEQSPVEAPEISEKSG